MRRTFFSILFLLLFQRLVVAGVTDYYDRIISSAGVEKGIIYSEQESFSSPLYLKTGLGYGMDDNKIINLNLYIQSHWNRLYINPEFVFLINEFSRIKFFITAGVDFGLIDKFETGFRTSEGIIFDLFNHLSLSVGLDTRFNMYSEFYVLTCGMFSFVIKI